MGYNSRMLTPPDWEHVFQDELALAEIARKAGNEGRARVCARRAAGIVVGEYYRRRKLAHTSLGVVDRLQRLQVLPDAPERAKKAAGLLLLHVTEEHALPVEADLINEARVLAAVLL